MAKRTKKKLAAKFATKAKTARASSKKKVQAIPARYSSVIPGFRVAGCAKAVDFLVKVFGAKVKDRFDGPNGALAHCELRIGDTTLMCGDAPAGDTQTLSASIYVKKCDEVFAKAVTLGARVKQPVTDQFYGDRSGRVVDAWGNEWIVATHIEDVSKKEMLRRMQAMTQQSSAA